MPKPRPPHLQRECTRHGKTVWYVRVGDGPRTRIKGEYGSPEFQAAYHAAVNAKPAIASTNSLKWLWDEYRKSPGFTEALTHRVKKQREAIMRPVLEKVGDLPVSAFTRKAIARAMNDRQGTMRRAFLKTMRGLFKWAADMEHVENDPTATLRARDPKTHGHHTWTVEELYRFMERWPFGTRERLAFNLLLYTGLRGADMVKLGSRHVHGDMIVIEASKNQEAAVIPISEPLRLSIEPLGVCETFFVNAYGRPAAGDTFRGMFMDACIAAGVPGRAHGLRKALATLLAENGATTKQLDAIFGWRGGNTSEIYTRMANKKKLALAGMDGFSIPAPSEIVPAPAEISE